MEVEQKLKRLWHRWQEVISSSINRQSSGRMSEEQYELLHGQIVELCRDFSNRRAATKMEQLVRPWVHLETIRRTEKRILRNLISQCEAIDDQLHWRHRFLRKMGKAAIRLAVLAAFAIALITAYTLWDAEAGKVNHLVEFGLFVRNQSGLVLESLQRPFGMTLFTVLLVIFGVMFTRYKK